MTAPAPADTGVMEDLRHRLSTLRDLRGPAVADFPGAVRDVVVIVSSSRGGSSMFAEILRRSDALLHLTAEINPFLRLAGLDHPAAGTGSDALGAGQLAALPPERLAFLGEELALDVGRAADRVPDGRYALDAAWRLAVQWPHVPMDPVQVAQTARAVLERVRRDRGWAAQEVREPALFLRALIAELVRLGLPVGTRYYDLPEDAGGSAAGPGLGPFLVEEPPFVLPRPWRPAGAADLLDRPLVIKTPSNVYRLGFLRALFRNARFRVLHLIRNPAAAINGLYDGWRHHGFQAHRMPEPLAIAGYVEREADNRWWWKFDLPPGWQAFTRAPLLDVCAFQWRSAHLAALQEAASGGVEIMTLRSEELMGATGARIAAFEEVADWLGVPVEGRFRQAVHDGIGPVVATAAPRAGRWRARASAIEQVLDGPTLAVADRLGYQDRTAWI
jgi:hypothetical protein